MDEIDPRLLQARERKRAAPELLVRTTEKEREEALRKYIKNPILRRITKGQFDFFADMIEILLPYLHLAVEKKVLIRELIQEHKPSLFKRMRIAYKMAKPFLRRNFGDELTAYLTTQYLIDLYGEEIRKQVKETDFRGWIFYNCLDFKNNFLR